MVLKKFVYYEGSKKKEIVVKPVSLFSTGLMFRKKSPPLLFTLPNKEIFFTSLFCRTFFILVINEEKKLVKRIKVSSWKFKIPIKARYVIEILE